MSLNRPQGAARNRATTTSGRLGAGVIRVLSVTAVAAAACSLWAGAASAATSNSKSNTTTKVSVSPNPQYVDSTVKLSATVTGGSTPTGTVQFWFGTRKLCTGTLSNGSTSCDYSGFADPATKTIVAKYSGSSSHNASSGTTTITIIKHATTTVITNPVPGTVEVGSKFTFDVTVTGGPTPTGSVALTAVDPTGLPSSFDCTAPLSGGTGQCSITATEYGIVDYTATYSGDSQHNGSTSSGTYPVEMKNATTTTAGPETATAGSVTLTGEVYADGADIDAAAGGTGTVTFDVATSPGGTPTVACLSQPLTSYNETTGDNQATCSDTLAAGTYYLTDNFSGDETNEPSTSATVELVVSS
jgi:large repetitive protein